MFYEGNLFHTSVKKMKMWYGHEDEYKSVEELLAAIDEYIAYYNTTRIVSKLKMSPVDYRNTVIDRPENNRTLFVERSSFFDLDEDEKIMKLSYSSTMKRSVITSKGNILSWGQLHLLGMGDDPKWSTNLPSPINLVQGIYQVDYYFTEEVDDYEHQIEGYQFLGRFTDSSLDSPFDLTNMPDEDVVVYGYYMVIGS